MTVKESRLQAKLTPYKNQLNGLDDARVITDSAEEDKEELKVEEVK